MAAVSDEAIARRRARDRDRYQRQRDERLAKARERYRANPEPVRAYQRAYREKHKDILRQGRFERALKSKYGVDLEWYAHTWRAQGYACAICGEQRDDLYVDHNHRTGAVRGLLCPTCNGQLHGPERDGWLERALEYLGQHA